MQSPGSFLPDLCTLTSTFALVGFSLLLAFVLTLADLSAAANFWSELGLRGLFITWITLVSGALLCVLRRFTTHWSATATGITALLIVELVTLGLAAAVDSLSLGGALGPIRGSERQFFYARIFGVSLLVTAACLRYLYVQAGWRQQIEAESEARLDALQARMRPHFLFNSLNTIASLTRRNPVLAEDMLLDLSELFRAVLKKDGKLVPLTDEINLTRQYLNIEQQRLGERLQVCWEMDGVPQDALIPPLSLQPLAENAIYHGVEPDRRGGRVELLGERQHDGLILTVRNSLPESGAQRTRQGTKEAVANLRARLETCFKGDAKLFAGTGHDGYEVRIIMPYRTRDHENSDRR